MKLSIKELNHLEELSCLKLKESDQEKFLTQLDSIIDFLGQLQNLDLEDIKLDENVENNLRTHKWTNIFENTKWIISNVKHEIVNNSIVIKSVLNAE